MNDAIAAIEAKIAQLKASQEACGQEFEQAQQRLIDIRNEEDRIRDRIYSYSIALRALHTLAAEQTGA